MVNSFIVIVNHNLLLDESYNPSNSNGTFIIYLKSKTLFLPSHMASIPIFITCHWL